MSVLNLLKVLYYGFSTTKQVINFRTKRTTKLLSMLFISNDCCLTSLPQVTLKMSALIDNWGKCLYYVFVLIALPIKISEFY